MTSTHFIYATRPFPPGSEKEKVAKVQWIFAKYPPLGGIRFGLEAELGQGGDTFLLGKYSSIPPGGTLLSWRLAWEGGDKSN